MVISDKLCVLIPYYNPCGYQRRLDNLKACIKSLSRFPNVDIRIGEASSSLFVTDAVDRFVANDVLWHKERILNLMIEKYAKDYKYIAWIDADIVFLENNAINKVIEQLESKEVVHMFETLLYTPKDFDINVPQSVDCQYINSDLIRRAVAPNERVAIVGGAWAAKSDWILKNKLYDKAIIGGGDTLFYKAILKEQNDIEFLTKEAKDDYLSWANSIDAPSVAFTQNKAIHLWHGDDDGRMYQIRHHILQRNNFNPSIDLKLNSDGLYVIVNNKIRDEVEIYFTNRKEDGESHKQRVLKKIDYENQARLFGFPVVYSEQPVIVGISSIPERRHSLFKTLLSLAQQSKKPDIVYVCLNRYGCIPEEFKNIKLNIKAHISDLESVGKFYIDSEYENKDCYRFTVDDDILYPDDYIDKMIRHIEGRNRTSLIGVHGIVMKENSKSFYGDRIIFPFQDYMPIDYYVHIIGTGTMAWHSSTYNISHKIFPLTNNDDCQLGVLTERNNIPKVIVARPRFWLNAIVNEKESSISFNHQRNPIIFDKAVSSISWKNPKKPLKNLDIML